MTNILIAAGILLVGSVLSVFGSLSADRRHYDKTACDPEFGKAA